MACRRPEKPAADPLVGLMDGLGIFPKHFLSFRRRAMPFEYR